LELKMPINLSIKNAPDDIVALLKLRAQQNHRSLQGELLAIVEAAVRPPRALSLDEVVAKIRRLGISSPSEAAAMIRADRDAR
jgi:antitoxin FitA